MEDHPTSLSPEGLVRLLEEKAKNLILLDVRSFVNFNQAHLESSINVCIPNALLKRKTFAAANIESTINCADARSRFRNRHGSEIILYDSDCEKLRKNCLLSCLVEKLKDERLAASVRFLQGGFQNFFTKFPQFCNLKSSSISLTPSLSSTIPCFSLSFPKSLSLLSPAATPSEFDKEPVEIFDYLYVGSQDVSSSLTTLEKYDITYIVNAAKECPDHFTTNPKYHYKRLELLDCATQSIDPDFFEETFRFIDEAREKGAKVLVHCRAGQSRSATIVISYIIRTYRWNLQQAYRWVQDKRPVVSPNLGFMAQLCKFEQLVLGRSTCLSKLLVVETSSPLTPPLFERATSNLPELVTIDCK